jgi:BRCA1-associated RING domain protein 1
MLCPLHASQKLPNETCGSQLKENKKYVQKKQANVKQSQVPVADTASQISRWDSHGLFSKIVICCSALTSIEKVKIYLCIYKLMKISVFAHLLVAITVSQEIVVKFEKLSGVTILKTWDYRVTHVIASVDANGASRRTLKYLMGILEGKWILTIECKFFFL